ncbi:probable RNA-binding protein 46 [Diorhabda sublineata]|uniref:probable RNA-binding protein 46 n=1 Tax=Diorhabda sublineata TaxID=1163346 RepID=UPI0024E0CDBF|nr:probable RNA-binding protein 46 [Diorhabda sublineata]
MVIIEENSTQERIIEEKRRARLTRRLKNLTDKSGYEIIQINGQRIYAPPASTNIQQPPKGCEIFIGKISRTIYEDELIPLFEKVGPLYKFRLMLDFNEKSRGYAFATFFNAEDANRAIKKFNNYEIRPNVHIGVYKSVDNCKLFIGNLPNDKTREEIYEMVHAYVSGVVDILMFQDYNNTNLNRGYAFIEFDNHRSAAMARRQLTPNNLRAWNRTLYVDWADPIPEINKETMSHVTILYLSNLPPNFNANEIRACICIKINPQIVLKVYKKHNYAFVHFINRGAAEYAYKRLLNFSIVHYQINVEWARPRCYSKKFRDNYLDHFCISVPPKIRKKIRNKRSNSGSSSCTSTESTIINNSTQLYSLACSASNMGLSFSEHTVSNNLPENYNLYTYFGSSFDICPFLNTGK